MESTGSSHGVLVDPGLLPNFIEEGVNLESTWSPPEHVGQCKVLQKVKGNKDSFELLATESRKLVYMIFHGNQNMEKKAVLPAGLGEQLDQVLKWVQFKFVFIV